MKGQDIIKALNDVDMEMIAAAENCEKVKNVNTPFRLLKYVATAAVMFVIMGICFGQVKKHNQQNVVCEVQNVRMDDIYILAEPKESTTYDSLEIKESEEFSKSPVIVELQLINGVSNDALVPQVGIGTNGSTLLKKAIREQHKKNSGEEVYYLVEIEVFVPHEEYPELATYADNDIYEAEYKRLTEEYGYDLTWIAPGGYTIPDAYVYCLGKGIMYGALTEEQMNNFPVKSEYSYGFGLTWYGAYNFANYPYKVTYTDTELFRSQMIALDALD